MRFNERDEARLEVIRKIKRYCLLCRARKDLDSREREKNAVVSLLQALKEEYGELYDSLRKQNKSAEEIQAALDNKRVCMDALDICKKCDKEVEQVSRFLSGY